MSRSISLDSDGGLIGYFQDYGSTTDYPNSTLRDTALNGPTNTKAERNRRKKQNAKKRKAEESQKKADEADLLSEMCTMSINESVMHQVGKGDSSVPCSGNGGMSSASQAEEKASEQHYLDPNGK